MPVVNPSATRGNIGPLRAKRLAGCLEKPYLGEKIKYEKFRYPTANFYDHPPHRNATGPPRILRYLARPYGWVLLPPLAILLGCGQLNSQQASTDDLLRKLMEIEVVKASVVENGGLVIVPEDYCAQNDCATIFTAKSTPIY